VRKDATENRHKLLDATRDVIRQHGDDAPLELITETAGVTRGTLYRNFADRADLYQAVLDAEIQAISRDVERNNDLDLFAVMRKLIDVSDIYHAFASAVQNTTLPTEACSPADLLTTIIAPPLAEAKKNGIVRADLTAEDVLLGCRMVSYGWRLDGDGNRNAAIARRLRLMIQGLAVEHDPRPRLADGSSASQV
jgi:AcrR family transcriptional regulator